MRNLKILSMATALCSFVTTPSYAANDKLYLHNGDTLSGLITAYNSESITIKADYGVFDVPLEYIQGAFAAGAAQNQDVQHILTNAEQEMASIAESQPVTLTPAPVALADKQDTLPAPEDKGDDLFWGAELSGTVNLGMSLKTGNSEKNGINLDATLKAEVIEHQFKLGIEYNREEDDGTVSVDNRSLSAAHDYFFTDQWFIGSTAKFEQDDIDRLDLRSTLSSGLGYQPYKADDLTLKFVAGPGYLYEEFEDGSDDNAMTVNWAMDYNQKFYDDLFRLFHNHELNAPNDDFDAYLFQSKSGIRVPLKQGIIASGQVDFDWDNDPALGTKEDDTTYSVKLGYEWP